MVTYAAYYDRRDNSIEGVFTIQEIVDGKATKIFERKASRSGQRGYTQSSWVRGKSPIPYTAQVHNQPYRLWTNCIGHGLKPGKTGIGEAFPISTGANEDLITDGTHTRTLIRLHGENAIPGSAGCIVIVKQAEFDKIAAYLEKLKADGIRWIPLFVV